MPFVIGLQNDLLAEIHNRKKVGDPFIVMYHFPGIDTIEDARSALDVNLVLQGEFICMGTEARLDLHLIDAANGGVLETGHVISGLSNRNGFVDWARNVSSDWLGLIALAAGEGTLAATPDLQVLFIEAQGHLTHAYDPDHIDNAIELLLQILQKAPDYARGHAVLVEAYYRKFRINKVPEWIDQAKTAAEKAGALTLGLRISLEK